jgi:hypothetical protein
MTLQTKAAEYELDSGVEDWGLQWASMEPPSLLYSAIVKKTRPPSILELIPRGKNQTMRVDIIKTEYCGGKKRVLP